MGREKDESLIFKFRTVALQCLKSEIGMASS